MEVMLETAGYLLKRDASRVVFLDGRPFSRRYQLERVIEYATGLDQPWRILECTCSEETARRRIEEQAHPAANRDFALYLRVKGRFEEIGLAKTVVDMERPLADCLEAAIKGLS